MPRTKRTRTKSDDTPGVKRIKPNSSILDYMSKIKTNLDIKQNTEGNGDATEHTDVEPASTSNAGKRSEVAIEHVSSMPESISDKLLSIEQELCIKLRNVTFPSSVQYIYNPLEYASETHAMYVHKYCTDERKILFVGMNPGPWGMSQTGVPFGEINMVRDWLKISGPVERPPKEHPDRRVTGFQCTRSEISGLRLWGLFRELCGSPDNFFRHAYMHNYCPLAFMDSGARNITPAELKGEGQRILHEACDKSLIDIIRLLKAEIIVGIGNYAAKRAEIAAQTGGLSVQVMVLRHPSPRAVGNKNWNETARHRLDELGLLKFLEKAIFVMDSSAWMDVALQKAEESLRAGEVPVGCLFVYNNEIIATGNNTVNETCNATRHAEMNCIDQVLEFCKEKRVAYETVFRNLDVIVTVEPCIMCTSALLQLQIRSIVYGCANDRFGGCVSVLEIPKLYDPKITIQGNVKGEKAMELLKDFYKGVNPNAPESKIKKGRKTKGISLTENK